MGFRNEYDGHTLEAVLEQVQKLTGKVPVKAKVDRGYRGKSKIGETEILIPSKPKKSHSYYQRKKLSDAHKKRAAIEPVIGHLKSNHRLNRNFYKGIVGDNINIMLAAAVFNFKRMINKWKSSLCLFVKNIFTMIPIPFLYLKTNHNDFLRGDFLVEVVVHDVSGGLISEIGGGDFGSGFASGAISSLISSAVSAIGLTGYYTDEEYLNYTYGPSKFATENPGLFKAIVISSGGLSGGISSSIAGGNFWKGIQQDMIVAGLNHLANHVVGNGGEQDPPKTTQASLGGALVLSGELVGTSALGSSVLFAAAITSLFGSYTPLTDDYFIGRSFRIIDFWSGFTRSEIRAMIRTELQFQKNIGTPGFYTVTFDNEMKYHGKGDPIRMGESAVLRMSLYNIKVKMLDWTPAINHREAYKAEYRRMQTDRTPKYPEGWRNPINYNDRNSPGKVFIQQNGF